MSFMLDPAKIAEEIAEAVAKGGSHCTIYVDFYQRPDHGRGSWVVDPVDKAVVTFVGSRENADALYRAATQLVRKDG